VEAVTRDWRAAPLSARQRAICEFADKLARCAHGTTKDDIEALRAAGLDDRSVLDLVQVIAYFSYVNRIASALGVSLEPERGGPEEG
jgi:uncharacterized peroxidase-related enzyme